MPLSKYSLDTPPHSRITSYRRKETQPLCSNPARPILSTPQPTPPPPANYLVNCCGAITHLISPSSTAVPSPNKLGICSTLTFPALPCAPLVHLSTTALNAVSQSAASGAVACTGRYHPSAHPSCPNGSAHIHCSRGVGRAVRVSFLQAGRMAAVQDAGLRGGWGGLMMLTHWGL